MELIDPPHLAERPARPYLGIRVVTPFRGMLAARDRLRTELAAWTREHEIATQGYGVFRLHVIDMEGPMDIEYGVFTDSDHEGDGRVLPASLPAGTYATLTFRDHARRAHGALLDWTHEQGIQLDRRDEAAGDAFACRYEAYLTDPAVESRKTRWAIELAIKVA